LAQLLAERGIRGCCRRATNKDFENEDAVSMVAPAGC